MSKGHRAQSTELRAQGEEQGRIETKRLRDGGTGHKLNKSVEGRKRLLLPTESGSQ